MNKGLLLNFEELKLSLEGNGYYIQENVLPQNSLSKLIEDFEDNLAANNFEQAAISRSLNQTTKIDIRNSKTVWINNWEKFPEVQTLLTDIMLTLNEHFFLSMKRFESQLAWYEDGGFYKKHLDVHKDTKHRQVTTILFLNNCLEGGELVIYNREDKNKIEKVITPSEGMLVTFFSSQIYHEVKETSQNRYSLTTWMRDDELLPFKVN